MTAGGSTSGNWPELAGAAYGQVNTHRMLHGHPRASAQRIFFWVFLLLGGLLTVHAVAYVIAFSLNGGSEAGWTPPPILAFPRLEMHVAEWAVPAIGAAGGFLMTGDDGDIALGVVVLLGPLAYLAWCALFVVRHHAYNEATEDGVRLSLSQEVIGATSGTANDETDHRYSEAPGAKSWKQYLGGLCKVVGKGVFIGLLGRTQENQDASWDPTDALLHYGAVYEAFRPRTRGQSGDSRQFLVIFREDDVVAAMGVLLLMEQTFMAVIVNGQDEDDKIGPLVVLLFTSLLFACMIRRTLPFIRRADMAVVLLAKIADIVVYICKLALFLPGMKRHTCTMGYTMIGFEVFSLMATLFEKLCIITCYSWPVLRPSWEAAGEPVLRRVWVAILERMATLRRSHSNGGQAVEVPERMSGQEFA
eukprot:evm.model.scf_868EXC.6 EVM.evm.TU.scf_868EXC.6   scf_868EXC:53740-57683(-)